MCNFKAEMNIRASIRRQITPLPREYDWTQESKMLPSKDQEIRMRNTRKKGQAKMLHGKGCKILIFIERYCADQMTESM